MLTKKQKDEIVERLAGTSGTYDHTTAEEYGIEYEDVEEIMDDAGYFRCEECEWWCEDADRAEEAEESNTCIDCS